MKKLALHWQILLGMVFGVAFGVLAASQGWGDFVGDWIKPFGTIFINSLKLIAIPLIVASLIKGITDLKDISKLSTMGVRTISLYISTTVLAIVIGLLIVNFVGPGRGIDQATRDNLLNDFAADAGARITQASEQTQAGPLQALVDLVPENIVGAAGNNGNMLQVIFFVIFFAIGLILIDPKRAQPVKDFFDGVNEVVLKLIDLIMLAAPYGVFALLASLVVEAPSKDLFFALLKYSGCVLGGLAIMIFIVYPMLVKVFTGVSYSRFMSGISPAQLLAFSTSSSAATLPVTMERVEEHLGVGRGGDQLRTPHRRHHQHGWYQPVPGRRGRVHRPGIRNAVGAGRSDHDHYHGPGREHRLGRRTGGGYGHAGDRTGAGGHPGGRPGPDLCGGPPPGHVPYGGQRDRRRDGGDES